MNTTISDFENVSKFGKTVISSQNLRKIKETIFSIVLTLNPKIRFISPIFSSWAYFTVFEWKRNEMNFHFSVTNTCVCQGVCDTNACPPGLQEQDGECVCPPEFYIYPDTDGMVQNKALSKKKHFSFLTIFNFLQVEETFWT